MDINGERLLVAALAAALCGLVYAALVHRLCQRDPDHPYTFVLVMFGVAGTLALALIVVPAQWVILLTGLFGVTGLPQIVGAMFRDHLRRRAIAESQRQALADMLQ